MSDQVVEVEEKSHITLRVWGVVLSVLTIGGAGLIGFLMVLWGEHCIDKGRVSTGRGWLKGSVWLGAVQLGLGLLILLVVFILLGVGVLLQ